MALSPLAFSISPTTGRVSGVVNGETFTVGPDHPAYRQILDCLATNQADLLLSILSPKKAVATFTEGRITYDPNTDTVLLDGQPCHSYVARRAVELAQKRLPFQHLLRFLDRLAQNPSMRATRELFLFLERENIPITADGKFVGFKRVRKPDREGRYFAHYNGEGPYTFGGVKRTGAMEYALGVETRQDRNTVDDDWGLACSEGIHVGTRKYVRGFHNFDGSPVMYVLVDPADVVTVPANEVDKLRTAAVTPIRFVDDADLGASLQDPVYVVDTATGTVTPVAGTGVGLKEAEIPDVSGLFSLKDETPAPAAPAETVGDGGDAEEFDDEVDDEFDDEVDDEFDDEVDDEFDDADDDADDDDEDVDDEEDEEEDEDVDDEDDEDEDEDEDEEDAEDVDDEVGEPVTYETATEAALDEPFAAPPPPPPAGPAFDPAASCVVDAAAAAPEAGWLKSLIRRMTSK